jgi:hypothetical protein
MKNINILKYFLLTFLILEISLLDAINLEIVDHNQDNETIAAYIGDTPSVVSIFGATPRYSFFAHFQETLANHLNDLVQVYKKSKRMKGVSRAIKETINNLIEGHNIEPTIFNALNFIKSQNFESQVDLFLNAGVNQKILSENVSLVT